ncbi:MAG: ATP-binding cassette domain-containing protein [Candidatus Hydrothermarchaeales archaeon]
MYNGKIKAVDSISLNIDKGEVFGLLGPNGAGKTTLLHMLSTLIDPTSGTARVNGYDIRKHPSDVRKSIGIVFQDPSSDDILTGYENLKLHGLMYGMRGRHREERIEHVLELVDLQDRADYRVRTYSGGMRRRLELARGLLHQPKIMFLDEPTLGLDPQTREKLWTYIGKLVKDEGITVIITTHYMEEADRLCDRVAIIDFGKIIVDDSPEDLKRVIGGGIITLKVKEPDMKALEGMNYIKKVERRDNIVCLTVTNAGKHLQEVLRRIGNVEDVELHSPTLNDVFLHYTGREIREDSPEGSYMERIARYKVKR